MRAIVVEKDGKIIGLAGVLHSAPKQAFSHFTDELRGRPVAHAKAAKVFKGVLGTYTSPIVAFPKEDEKNARGFLKWIGFVPVSETEEVFVWTQKQSKSCPPG